MNWTNQVRGLAFCCVALASFACSGSKPDAPKEAGSPAAVPAPAHGAADGSLKFSAPPEWVSEPPSSSMRQAQYRLPRAEGDSEDAEMVVFFFQGQGGPVQANIDRWISQFTKADGSPANDSAKVSKRESNAIPLSVVDVSGTYSGSAGPMMSGGSPKPNFRMIAAVAEHSSGPWFFKLTGPARTVARWETSFHKFLETIR